ncbi:MAG TPA: hypothetical protein VMW54_08975 [Terriglobia bacterium]|nr:hypothetical protein [Terriglobia bacterium]
MTKKKTLAAVFALAATLTLGAGAGYKIGRTAATNNDNAPLIGSVMQDGTIYAGISPDIHKPMYATTQDAPGLYSLNNAVAYCSALQENGRHDFHAPSEGELDVLYQNRDKGRLKGTFNETGSYPAGWYGSSSPDGSEGYGGWAQSFRNGKQRDFIIFNRSSLRCVR